MAAKAVTTVTTAAALHSLPSGAGRYVCIWATADWCVPCKRLQPGWDSIANAEDSQFTDVTFLVANLTHEADEDVGHGSSLSEVLQITTLPTFILRDRHSNCEVSRVEGAAHKRPARRLYQMLKEHASGVAGELRG